MANETIPVNAGGGAGAINLNLAQAISSVMTTFVTMLQTWMQVYIQMYMIYMMFSIFRDMFSMFRPPAAGG